MQSFIEMWIRVFIGRVNRIQYFKGMLFIGYVFGAFTLVFLLLMVDVHTLASPAEILTAMKTSHALWVLFPLYFLQAIFSVGLSVRRLRDCNFPSMFVLISFLPYMNIPFFLFLLFKKGNQTINQYGNVPYDNRDVISVIINK